MIDLNVEALLDKDLRWADYIFLTAMSVQKESVQQILQRCKPFKAKTVAGGPLFTSDPDSFPAIDHLVLNEAELTLPLFLEDVINDCTKKIYNSDAFPELKKTPPPDYSLIKIKNYSQMSIQFSRGCPFNCEFCEITTLLGRKFRTKSSDQILQELENIFLTGFRGRIFFVDDNFIGNQRLIKKDLLPRIIDWLIEHKHPFSFITETSINLSDDAELMDLMVRAGFTRVFIGIESPNDASLTECNKHLNIERNMMECVQTIHSAGIEVSAGFIVGFDNDSPKIFQQQIDFIQSSGIITAMVGLLNAPDNTLLYKRLASEGRILKRSDGNNTSLSLNFIPKMDKDLLVRGYQHIISSIYSAKSYYERLRLFLKNYYPRNKFRTGLSLGDIKALLRSVFYIGIVSSNRIYYWKLLFWSITRRPELFPMAITYSIYGYHFRKIFGLEV